MGEMGSAVRRGGCGLHPQVAVAVGDWMGMVDQGVAELIEAFWQLGIEAWLGCQDAKDNPGKASFQLTVEDTMRLYDLVVGYTATAASEPYDQFRRWERRLLQPPPPWDDTGRERFGDAFRVRTFLPVDQIGETTYLLRSIKATMGPSDD